MKKSIKEKNVNSTRKTSKKNRSKISRKDMMRIMQVLLIIVVIILAVLITNKVSNNKEKNNNYECTELEKIALEDFVNRENLTMLTDGNDKDTLKVNYILNKYLDSSSQVIMPEEAIKIYEDTFDDNNKDNEAKINEVLNSSNMFSREKYKDNSLNNAFKCLTCVKKIQDGEYNLYIDSVYAVDKQKLLDNYHNSNKKLTADLINIDSNVEFSNEENNRLLKYVTKDNYNDVAMSINKLRVQIKVKDGKIIIEDFENLNNNITNGDFLFSKEGK